MPHIEHVWALARIVVEDGGRIPSL